MKLDFEVDARFAGVRAALLALDERSIVAEIARELEDSFALWTKSARDKKLAAVRFSFAGQELEPWVATDAIASGYATLTERDGAPRFGDRVFDSCGGFALYPITGELADLGEDDELSDHADFSRLREALHAFALEATTRALREACASAAFAKVPRAAKLVFFAARHDERPVVVFRASSSRA